MEENSPNRLGRYTGRVVCIVKTEFWIKRLKRLGDIREEEEKLKSLEKPGE